ncbi:DUF1491 family protein [Sphingomonas sp.]|uniref:DUF1491 family protein n=1 Tax=Sphingomonas sp. TaxID=28214 RepID=UPI003AFFAA93
MSGRLPAHIEISGLIRRSQALGGHAAVLRRGERDAGAILVLIAERGAVLGLLERVLRSRGHYGWQFRSREEIEQKQVVNDYLERRGLIDSDLWVLELDIPDAERFAAEMTSTG